MFLMKNFTSCFICLPRRCSTTHLILNKVSAAIQPNALDDYVIEAFLIIINFFQLSLISLYYFFTVVLTSPADSSQNTLKSPLS